MTKKEALTQWSTLDPDQPILEHMDVIPYKSRGSTYGACGIRIDGNSRFIDAVLSHLKELIDGESVCTRLQFSRGKVDGKGLNKSFNNRSKDAECVYIRLCERGREGKIFHAIIDQANERID